MFYTCMAKLYIDIYFQHPRLQLQKLNVFNVIEYLAAGTSVRLKIQKIWIDKRLKTHRSYVRCTFNRIQKRTLNVISLQPTIVCRQQDELKPLHFSFFWLHPKIQNLYHFGVKSVFSLDLLQLIKSNPCLTSVLELLQPLEDVVALVELAMPRHKASARGPPGVELIHESGLIHCVTLCLSDPKTPTPICLFSN